MHPIEVMLIVALIAAPVTAVAAAVRWKKAPSRPAGWRSSMTLVSLGFFALVCVEFILMMVGAGYFDFNAHYEEYLLWLRVMLASSLLAVLAAAVARGAGRILSLVSSFLLVIFVCLVASIPP